MTTIYHNPACSTSRRVLAILRAAGAEPEVIDYLKTGWTRETLAGLLAAAGLTAAEALRRQRSAAQELGLLAPETSEAAIFDAMLAHPALVERPFVVTPKGTRLCRPVERLRALIALSGPIYDPQGALLLDD